MEKLVDIELLKYFIDNVICVKYKSIKRYDIKVFAGGYTNLTYIDIKLYVSRLRYREDICNILFYYKRMLGYQESILSIMCKKI